MLNNVKDFNATGNGITDDRLAIQSAIQDAITNQKAGIFFPTGVYRVSREPRAGIRWSLDLNSVQEFMIMGEGPRSIVKLLDSELSPSLDWHVFVLRNNCRKVVFQDLVIDGNQSGLLPSPEGESRAEQLHGLEVEDGTEDLVIDRCTFRECYGDGIRLVGADQVGENVRRVRIENTLFQRNRRSGIVFQSGIEQIIIANCTFEDIINDNSIDFEPSSGLDAPTDIIIEGCIIRHTNSAAAVTLGGVSGLHPLTNCKFTNNIVVGGSVFCGDLERVTIQNNTVIVNQMGTVQRIPLQIQRGGKTLVISGNTLINEDSLTGAALSLSEVNGRQVTQALVSNNLCMTKHGNGIECLSSDDIAIHNNMVVAAGSCTQGVFVRTESSNMDNISIQGNDITVQEEGNWISGIRVATSSGFKMRQLTVMGNSIRNTTNGIFFENKGFEATPLCSQNRIADSVRVPLVGLENLPESAIITGGATSRGGTASNTGSGRIMMGLGNPNNKVMGDIGDVYQRLDGSASSSFYVKENGSRSKTGWAQK